MLITPCLYDIKLSLSYSNKPLMLSTNSLLLILLLQVIVNDTHRYHFNTHIIIYERTNYNIILLCPNIS